MQSRLGMWRVQMYHEISIHFGLKASFLTTFKTSQQTKQTGRWRKCNRALLNKGLLLWQHRYQDQTSLNSNRYTLQPCLRVVASRSVLLQPFWSGLFFSFFPWSFWSGKQSQTNSWTVGTLIFIYRQGKRELTLSMPSRFSIPFTFLSSDRNLVCLERCAISQRTTVRKTVLADNDSSYEFIYLFIFLL